MNHLFSSSASSIVLGIAALAWICERQLQRRRVRQDRGFTAVIVLATIGALQLTDAAGAVSDVELAATAVGLITGAAFGALRASRTRLWRESGVVWRQGTWLTVALWVIGIGVHIGIEVAGGALAGAAHAGARSGTATLLLYLAVSLGAQRAVLLARANALPASGPSTVF